MAYVDLSRLDAKTYVNEAHHVAGEWEFWIEGLEEKFKVKVLQFNRVEQPYMGIASHEVKCAECSSFYISLSFFDTVQDAVEDSLRGFLGFYDPQDERCEVRRYEGY